MGVSGTSNQNQVNVNPHQNVKNADNNLAKYNQIMRRADTMSLLTSGKFKVSVRVTGNKSKA